MICSNDTAFFTCPTCDSGVKCRVGVSVVVPVCVGVIAPVRMVVGVRLRPLLLLSGSTGIGLPRPVMFDGAVPLLTGLLVEGVSTTWMELSLIHI